MRESRRQVKVLMKAGFESVESRYVESCMRTTRVDISRKLGWMGKKEDV